MPTELIPRQLELEFDYEGYEISGESRTVLESCADQIHDMETEVREHATDKAMHMASNVKDARDQFNKQDDTTWEAWVKERLGKSVSWANKLLKVHKVLGSKDKGVLAGVPVDCLYLISQDKTSAKARNRVLKAAEGHWLNVRDVHGIIGEANGKANVEFNAAVPGTHEELFQHLGKKCSNLKKRLDDEMKDELPAVLRELADAADEL